MGVSKTKTPGNARDSSNEPTILYKRSCDLGQLIRQDMIISHFNEVACHMPYVTYPDNSKLVMELNEKLRSSGFSNARELEKSVVEWILKWDPSMADFIRSWLQKGPGGKDPSPIGIHMSDKSVLGPCGLEKIVGGVTIYQNPYCYCDADLPDSYKPPTELCDGQSGGSTQLCPWPDALLDWNASFDDKYGYFGIDAFSFPD